MKRNEPVAEGSKKCAPWSRAVVACLLLVLSGCQVTRTPYLEYQRQEQAGDYALDVWGSGIWEDVLGADYHRTYFEDVRYFLLIDDLRSKPSKTVGVYDASVGLGTIGVATGEEWMPRVDFLMGASARRIVRTRIAQHIDDVERWVSVLELDGETGRIKEVEHHHFSDPYGRTAVLATLHGRYVVFPNSKRVLDVPTMSDVPAPKGLWHMLDTAFALDTLAGEFWLSDDLQYVVGWPCSRLIDHKIRTDPGHHPPMEYGGRRYNKYVFDLPSGSFERTTVAFYVERTSGASGACPPDSMPFAGPPGPGWKWPWDWERRVQAAISDIARAPGDLSIVERPLKGAFQLRGGRYEPLRSLFGAPLPAAMRPGNL